MMFQKILETLLANEHAKVYIKRNTAQCARLVGYIDVNDRVRCLEEIDPNSATFVDDVKEVFMNDLRYYTAPQDLVRRNKCYILLDTLFEMVKKEEQSIVTNRRLFRQCIDRCISLGEGGELVKAKVNSKSLAALIERVEVRYAPVTTTLTRGQFFADAKALFAGNEHLVAECTKVLKVEHVQMVIKKTKETTTPRRPQLPIIVTDPSLQPMDCRWQDRPNMFRMPSKTLFKFVGESEDCMYAVLNTLARVQGIRETYGALLETFLIKLSRHEYASVDSFEKDVGGTALFLENKHSAKVIWTHAVAEYFHKPCMLDRRAERNRAISDVRVTKQYCVSVLRTLVVDSDSCRNLLNGITSDTTYSVFLRDARSIVRNCKEQFESAWGRITLLLFSDYVTATSVTTLQQQQQQQQQQHGKKRRRHRTMSVDVGESKKRDKDHSSVEEYDKSIARQEETRVFRKFMFEHNLRKMKDALLDIVKDSERVTQVQMVDLARKRHKIK